MLRCFCALTRMPPNLPNSVLTLARVLADMVGTLWILRVLKPTDRELSRADRVLGPADNNLFFSSQIIKEDRIADDFRIKSFCRNKQDSKIGRPRWRYVLALDILGETLNACQERLGGQRSISSCHPLHRLLLGGNNLPVETWSQSVDRRTPGHPVQVT